MRGRTPKGPFKFAWPAKSRYGDIEEAKRDLEHVFATKHGPTWRNAVFGSELELPNDTFSGTGSEEKKSRKRRHEPVSGDDGEVGWQSQCAKRSKGIDGIWIARGAEVIIPEFHDLQTVYISQKDAELGEFF